MKSHCVFFAEGVLKRCKHGKLLPKPKTREQREAEREQFNKQFFLWCGVAYAIGILLVLAWYSARGGR